MPRILLVAQDKGGSGKSVMARALAEAVPDAPVIEIDEARRLIELEDRVQFFPMRSDLASIEDTGGTVSRAQFDGPIDAMTAATLPTIVDIGANTSKVFLPVLTLLANDLRDAGLELGLLLIVSTEPAALTSAPLLMAEAKPWAAARFVIENRMLAQVDAKQLARIADGAVVSVMPKRVMDNEAIEILLAGGLASIPKLDKARLIERHDTSRGGRIWRDLTGFRLAAMQAVQPAAEWLVGEGGDAPAATDGNRTGGKRARG